MRNRGRNKSISAAAAEFLRRNYDKLMSEARHLACQDRFYESCDLFQETALYVLTDQRCETIASDKEFRDYFHYRYEMIRFQTTKDYNNELKKNADYQQAKKRASDDEGE